MDRHWSASATFLAGQGAARRRTSGRVLAEPNDRHRYTIARSKAADRASQFVSGLLELALSILIAFFLFRNGESAAEQLGVIIERVAGVRGRRLLTLSGSTVRGVVYGILGTALVQAVMAGVGYLSAGVPGAGMLALRTFFLSVVPIGPPLIWIPAALWLFHEGSTGWGVFMLVWGFGVSSIDNVGKPWLISQGSDMPFLLIFFGVLGGALTFGFIGVFLGPTLLAVGYRLVTEWVAGAATVTTADRIT